MWYICVLCTQPQNRFTFLYPLHIAEICIITTFVLHAISVGRENRPFLRFGPATILAIFLMFFSYISLHVGLFQTNHAWNPDIDLIFKNSFVLILVEAMAFNVGRVWGVQATLLLATLWWVKAGLRLSASGSTFSGDRIQGAAVSIIENPNGFAYLMAVMLPMYLFFFQQETRKMWRYFFLGLTGSGIFIIMQTGSRTGTVALLALSVFLIPKYLLNNKRLLIGGGAVIFFIVSIISPGNIERFRSIPAAASDFFFGARNILNQEKSPDEMTQDEQSAWERRMKNAHTWMLIKQHPLFGVGVEADDALIPGDMRFARGQVHNELLYAGKQMGIIGMGLYLGFIITLISRAWLVLRYCKSWWPSAANLGWTLLLQGVVFIAAGFFSPIAWNPVFLILTGSASALLTNLRQGLYDVARPAIQSASIPA